MIEETRLAMQRLETHVHGCRVCSKARTNIGFCSEGQYLHQRWAGLLAQASYKAYGRVVVEVVA